MSKIKLPDGRYITLNEQQIEGLELAKSWLKNQATISEGGSPLLFCLQGFAGTGKTTIIKEALNWWMHGPGSWDRKVAVTAPTHKAKKVVSDATGLVGKTIQSLVGLAPNTDVLHFDINNPEFALKGVPGIKKYSVVLIDEASMLNTELFELLVKQATECNSKLLFMCDSAQLPPIGEEISPVITSPLVGVRYQLTKVERQAGDNPLMLIYDAIRNDINAQSDQFEHKTNLVEMPKPVIEGFDPNNEDQHAFDERLDAWNKIKPEFMGAEFLTDEKVFGGRTVTAFVSTKFQEDPNYCKVLCWTNKRVKFWNDAIRNTMMAQRRAKLDPTETVHDRIILPGELLTGYVTSGFITTSAEYRILELDYLEETTDYGDWVDPNNRALGRMDSATFNVYHVRLQEVNNEVNEFPINIVEPTTENYKNFLMPFNWYLSMGKFKKWWSMYYSWKENYLLLTDIRSADKKLIVKKDLDYAYALSTHKSQGSTYTHVFVDEVDIDQLEDEGFVKYIFQEDRKEAVRNKQTKWFDNLYPNYKVYYRQKLIEKNKLKYVAFSRPKHKAVIFTKKTS